MPRAGSFSYPSRDLDDCVSYLRRARESSKSRTMTRGGFARAMDLAASGGGFGKLVGAMIDYGLIETGRNQVSTTDLGEQIIYGTREEQRAASEKSVRRVRLFSEIYRKLGKEPADDQLRVFLREKAGLDVITAKGAAFEIGKLLRNNSAHVSSEATARAASEPARMPDASADLVARLEMQDYGILNIRDEISMDLAIRLLTEVKKRKGWSGSADPGAQSNEGAKERGYRQAPQTA